MSRQRSKATIRKRTQPPAHWGLYLLAGALLLAGLAAAGAADRMLAKSASPGPFAATASSAAGGGHSAQTLYAHGDRLRPLVEETDGVQTLNIYGPGGRIIAQVAQDGQGGQEARHLLADHLGSTRAALDGDGNSVARFEYEPYGETMVVGTAGTDVQYRYTGHPYNEGQEVYETPARGYDPTTGRFLSVDPQRQDASPYVYAGNNPVLYKDPSGKGRVGTTVTPQVLDLAKELVSKTSQYESISKFFSEIKDPAVFDFFSHFARFYKENREIFDRFAYRIMDEDNAYLLEAAFFDLRKAAPDLPIVNVEQTVDIMAEMKRFHRLVYRHEALLKERTKVLTEEFEGKSEKLFRSRRSWEVMEDSSVSTPGAQKGYGYCGYIARCIAGEIAETDPEVNVEVFKADPQVEHDFVVVGRDPKTDASKPMTWNKDAHIVDGWLGRVDQANEYYAQGKDLTYFNKEFSPEIRSTFE